MKKEKLFWQKKTLITRKYIFIVSKLTHHIRLIIHFKPEDVDKDFKVDWKQVERAVKDKYPALKLVYSRADPLEGDLAFS